MKKINIAKGIIASHFFRKPFYIHFYVTRKCNFRCGMCNVWKQQDAKQMDIEEIRLAAQKIKDLGTAHVIITGGEPLLRGDLEEIVSLFSQLGVSTRLQTNGLLLTEEKLDKLLGAGLDDITISLDTLDDGKQAEICGVANLKIASQAVKMLRVAVRKIPKSMVVASIVVSHKNLEEIPSLIKYLDSVGVWTTPMAVNLPEGKGNSLFKARADDFSFTKEDKKRRKKSIGKLTN